MGSTLTMPANRLLQLETEADAFRVGRSRSETESATKKSFCSSRNHSMSVNLGPMAVEVDPMPSSNPRSDGLGYNPRCLRRDMSNYLTTRYATTSQVASMITTYNNIGDFQTFLQGQTGPHFAGHFTIAGDPGSDFYVSPGDPAFWLHHSMIDRSWYIWQSQDLQNRMQVISGGTSMFGGGAAQKLTDNVDLSNLVSKVYQIKDLVSTTDGPFCYVYE
jgi:tyrosinase